MKAIVYGHENTYKALAASLENEGIEIVRAEDDFFDAAPLKVGERYDLAIVDSRSDSAKTACRYIRENLGIPLVLVIDSIETNWKGVIPIDADGYIPEVKKGGELTARARALLRRLFLKKPNDKNCFYAI